MSMARKILFSDNDPTSAPNIEGLLAALRKASPGRLAALQDGGGRIQGHAMADDSKSKTGANDCLVTQVKKV